MGYYEGSDDQKPKDVVPIRNCTVTVVPPMAGRQHCVLMQIDTAVHTKAKYFLAADSFEEMAAWQAAIAGAVQSEDDNLDTAPEPELGTSMYPRLSASETAAGAAPARARGGAMRRENCRYGSACYQQNAAHRAKFAHPG